MSIYRVRQKSSALEFFCRFLRIGLEFQGEIFHTCVVIIYVHIGINSIYVLILIHCLDIISIPVLPCSDFSALENVRANTQ